MFLHAVDVNYLSEYKVRVTFNDGVTKDIDLSKELYGEVFEPLKDKGFFRQVTINPETKTIEWPTKPILHRNFFMRLAEKLSLKIHL